MSKNKHGDLFNTSLTEIIIILFFVLMLFALYNIDKVNKENMGLGDQVDLLTNDVDILIDRANTFQEIIEANNKPSSLAPINAELAQQIFELKRENKALENKIAELKPSRDELTDETSDIASPELPIDSTGDCNDGFWRECAEKAWPIASNPPYEYLLDVGVCSSGDILAIKSQWKEKREIDFIMVDGASSITNQMYITASEIDKVISLIHNKSLDFKPEQTQHVARVIALEPIYETEWGPAILKLEQHLKLDTFKRGSKKHQKILERFSENACSFFNSDVQEDNKPLPQTTLPESKIPSTSSVASFEWDGTMNCDRASGRTSSKFIIKLNLKITSKKRVEVTSYDYDKTNRNNRLVAIDLKKSLTQQRKNIVPATKNGKPVSSSIQKNYTIPANVCR
ncbi:hypothetical protein OAC45_03975 [Gammaproteobacteria bacterium]|nr:hypothetical protein [Gammaproteobacteria bacterium]